IQTGRTLSRTAARVHRFPGRNLHSLSFQNLWAPTGCPRPPPGGWGDGARGRVVSFRICRQPHARGFRSLQCVFHIETDALADEPFIENNGAVKRSAMRENRHARRADSDFEEGVRLEHFGDSAFGHYCLLKAPWSPALRAASFRLNSSL